MSATAAAGLQRARESSPHTERARYFDSGNAFAIKYPPVPRHAFAAERDQVFAPDTATGLIPLDLSAALEVDAPATTPLILARYGRVRAGETLDTHFLASGEIFYVIRGQGRSVPADGGAEAPIAWREGDVFFLGGGEHWRHTAEADAVLWIVTDEPQLAFQGLPAPEHPQPPVHYPAETIAEQLEALHRKPDAAEMPGYAVVFSHAAMEQRRNVHPTMTLALNSLPSGETQRPHHHNSVAVNLCLDSEGGYSIGDGKRLDWSTHLVFVTPPGAVHSHHNDGPNLNRLLIVQDGGIHYHCRTMGFGYD